MYYTISNTNTILILKYDLNKLLSPKINVSDKE